MLSLPEEAVYSTGGVCQPAETQHLLVLLAESGPPHLICGYHQIPVHLDDDQKMAITTPFKFLEFLRMPFGLYNAAALYY